MFSKVLVPVDLTDKNRRAVEIAAKTLADRPGQVHLLHVIETLADTDFSDLKEFYQRLEQKAWTALEALTEPFSNGPANVTAHVAYGRRAESILAFADENSVDLIVVNSHKIQPDDPMRGWGTISYKVGLLSQCPVLLVK